MDIIHKPIIWILLVALLTSCNPAETPIPTSTPTFPPTFPPPTVSPVPTTAPTSLPPTASPIPTKDLTSLPFTGVSAEMARVFYTFFDALNGGNVDLAMSLVADDAEICFQTCRKSPEAVRQMLQGMVSNRHSHQVVISRIEGDTIYFQHIVYVQRALLLRGENVMVVQDGKIKKLRGL